MRNIKLSTRSSIGKLRITADQMEIICFERCLTCQQLRNRSGGGGRRQLASRERQRLAEDRALELDLTQDSA